MTVNSLYAGFPVTDTEVYISELVHRDDEGCFKINPCGTELLIKEKESTLFLFLSQTTSVVRIRVVNKIPYSKSLHFTSHSIDTILAW